MGYRESLMAMLVAVAIGGCGGDAAGPTAGGPGTGGPGTGGPGTGGPGTGGPGAGVATATVTDRAGDTFGNRGSQWDLTAMTVTRDTAGITVVLEFSTALVSPTSGDSNAMIAFVDLDTDQDSATGSVTTVDEFRRDGGSTGMGSDYHVALTGYDPDSSVAVNNALAGVTGRIKPEFSGNKVTLRIPRAMLGNDDGFLNAAAIVGTLASPTDFVPESGHLQLDGAASSIRSSLRRSVFPAPGRPAGWLKG